MAQGQESGAGNGSKSWWTTLPGVLTGVAAVVTALTGLFVALDQIRGDDGGGEPRAAASTPADDQHGESPAAGAYTVSFPEGARATLGDYRYDVLSGSAEPNNPGELRLELRVRLTNMSAYDANFWDGTFRLVAAGETGAPEGGLNEVVAGGTDAEGTVVFTLPHTERSPVLLVGEGDEAVRLPLALAKAE